MFTGVKYLEYGITAFIFFSLANLVSVAEYGEATPGFIAISYSSLIILGINQVLIKWHALAEVHEERKYLIRYNLIYNLIFSFIVIAVVSFIVPLSYGLIIGGIAGLKLIQESLINICRAKQDLVKINVIYISFALIFLLSYLFFVDTIEDFFTYWLVSISFSVTLAILLNTKNIFTQINLDDFYKWLKQHFKKLIFDGLKLASIGAVLPLYLSIDRLLLIKFESVSDEMIGNLQLADNIATVVSFGISSVLFITNPVFIEKLKNKTLKPSQFIDKGYKIMFGLTFLLCIFLYPLNWVASFIFEKYEFLTFPLSFYLFSRLFFIGLFIPNILMITYSYELSYLKIVYTGFSILLIAYLIVITSFSSELMIINTLPGVLCCTVILVHLMMRNRLKKLHLG